MFVGFSDQYSSTVSRVLNIYSGLIPPQFHVVHDELFTTVNNSQVTNPEERWEILVEIGRENDWEPDYNQYGNDLPAPTLSRERKIEI